MGTTTIQVVAGTTAENRNLMSFISNTQREIAMRAEHQQGKHQLNCVGFQNCSNLPGAKEAIPWKG